jgi:hypothetical protein
MATEKKVKLIIILEKNIEHRFDINSDRGIIPNPYGQIYENLSDTQYNRNNSFLNQGICRNSIRLEPKKDYQVNDFSKTFKDGVLYLWDDKASEELREFLKNM